ncbi:MAG: hypothetical protein K0S48_3596, partial [Ramlibacter sp.]|nr:hypothetical protein [Ramlibacter sp.]
RRGATMRYGTRHYSWKAEIGYRTQKTQKLRTQKTQKDIQMSWFPFATFA